MFERFRQGFTLAPQSTNSQPNSKKKNQNRKCWRKDCEVCLGLFVRAYQILSLGLVEIVDLKQFNQSNSLNVDFVKVKKRAPLIVLITFAMMLLTIVVSAATFLLLDKQFPVFGSPVSITSDFLIMTIFTTTSFFVIIRILRNRVRYSKFVHHVLSNLFEIPAIYCLPNQALHEELIITEDSVIPNSANIPVVVEPDQSILTFTMISAKNHYWHRTMGFHFHSIILSICYIGFSGYHLISGCYHMLEVSSGKGFLFCGFITIGFSMQGFFYVLYPLVCYSYICICLVLYIQSEHLNQFIRRIRERSRQNRQLPLKEELDLIRVWYSRVAHSVLDLDRFGHPVFFALYAGQTVGMFFKSLQVNLIFKLGAFTVESYFQFAVLGLNCYAIIHLLQTINVLNRSIKKPGHYMSEIGMNSSVNEPYPFSDYLRTMEHRFEHRHCQLTFLRIIPIGKEFFLITIFLIISAVASFSSFGQLLLEMTHQLHFLI